jgi:hypothetical protein
MADENKEHWHVGKEIPLAMLLTMVAQTLGVVWWAATLSSKVEALEKQIISIAASQFTSVEARGMVAINALHNTEMDRRLTILELRLREIEGFKR